MNCGKALPASPSLTIQPIQKPSSSKGDPKKVRAIIFSLTALFIVLAVFSLIAGRQKEPVKKSSKYDKDLADYQREDIVTIDSAVIPPMGTIQQPAYEGTIVPPGSVPDDAITVAPAAPDTVTLEMPKPSPPTYINSYTRELQFFSPCYVIITGFYKDYNMARNEAKRLTSNGYEAAYINLSSFPVFNYQNYYATVIGPYETSSECWDRLRSLPRIGPHWYGVKLTLVAYDRVELKP
jgi:hypothetical protein